MSNYNQKTYKNPLLGDIDHTKIKERYILRRSDP